MDTTITIKYSTTSGSHGRFTVHLPEFLPSSQRDFRRLLAIVDMATDYEDIAMHTSAIYEYIRAQVDGLRREIDVIGEYTDSDKQLRARIKARADKYRALASILSAQYGTPEIPPITEEPQASKLTNGIVYALVYDRSAGMRTVKQHIGHTFYKGGYRFEVYREGGKGKWIILLSGTGMTVVEAAKKADIVASIDKRILAILDKSAEKIAELQRAFRDAMIQCGFSPEDSTQPERVAQSPEIESQEAVQESREFFPPACVPASQLPAVVASAADASIDTTTSAADSAADKEETMVTYERDAIVCKGVTFEATYNISVQGAVLCFAILARQGGRARKAKLVITPDHADFPAALVAAKAHLQAHLSPALYEEVIARLDSPQEIPETAQAVPETVQASQAAPERPQEPQAVQETAREPQEAVQATQDAAQAPRRASAGSKDFVGTEIRGAGWLIRFDEDLQRTRVIFPDTAPSPAVQAAVEQAGFYYSRAMGSWNKKLTTKAHRAALALAEELTRICGAA